MTKAFGVTCALDGASLELRPGEIHAIVGENGSGKSTLAKVLAGVHRPESGRLDIGELSVPALRSPAQAARAGVATVFQEVLVVPPRSVVENVWIGGDGLFRRRTPGAVKRQRATETLTTLLGTAPPLDTPVELLSLSDRQATVIARALVRDPKVIVLDEATSALDVATRDRLFAELRRRARAGCAVIFISHRMDEIEEIGDRITVMRSGRTVATLRRGETDVSGLVRLMTGAEQLTASGSNGGERELGDVVLRVDALTLRAGELVGLAGLEGHGQDEFIKRLAAVAGEVARYLPRERRAEALFESKSIVENFALPTYDRDTTAGIIRPKRARGRFRRYVAKLGIAFGRPDDSITTLSGGNQQKVVMARCLASDPRVLLLNDPTRGIDLGAKRDLYQLLSDLTAGGTAVVMLSTEVDEHVELMDRVLVFRDGQMFCEIERSELSRHALVAAFFGSRRAGERMTSHA